MSVYYKYDLWWFTRINWSKSSFPTSLCLNYSYVAANEKSITIDFSLINERKKLMSIYFALFLLYSCMGSTGSDWVQKLVLQLFFLKQNGGNFKICYQCYNMTLHWIHMTWFDELTWGTVAVLSNLILNTGSDRSTAKRSAPAVSVIGPRRWPLIYKRMSPVTEGVAR